VKEKNIIDKPIAQLAHARIHNSMGHTTKMDNQRTYIKERNAR